MGEDIDLFTVLDPRYSPDPPTMPNITGTGTDPDSDVFNPSRFMVVFEAGDNTTVASGAFRPGRAFGAPQTICSGSPRP